MSRLRNKVAVITGGTSGIGLAAAQRFVAEGAFVYIFARRQAELDKTVASIGRNIVGVQGDVRNLEDLDRLYAKIASDRRKLDVVVANVGAVNSVKLTDVTIESFNHNFDVNARGVLFTAQKALPVLNDGASVILTSTIASLRGFPGRSAYAASKTALRSYARTWTMELKDRGIRVNTIAPGPCDTPLSTPRPVRPRRQPPFGPNMPGISRWAVWRGPKRSQPGCCSWRRMTAASSLAANCWWTAACARFEADPGNRFRRFRPARGSPGKPSRFLMRISMAKLQGKVAIITGGGTGQGLATARRFVDEGAFVYITGAARRSWTRPYR